MKKPVLTAVSLCLALALSACGGAPPSSSRDPFAVFDEMSGAQSAASSGAASAVAPDASGAADGASSLPDASSEASGDSAIPDGSLCFVSLPVSRADGSTGDNALVILTVPGAWSYDNYTTFSRDERKVAEVARLWQAADAAAPFSDAMVAPYQDNSMYPEGFGLLSDEVLPCGEGTLRLLQLKLLMDGDDTPWYLYAAFYARDGYVVETHFFSQEPWGGADSELFCAVLASIELHVQEDAG